jgi:flagellar hook-length control protein FliK
MNVSATPTPAAAGGHGSAASRETGTAAEGTAGPFDAFVELLAQVTAPVAGVAAGVASATATRTAADADTDEAPSALDWALPFLVPAGTPSPTPLDLELPDPSGMTGVAPTGADGRSPTPSPVMPDLIEIAVAPMAGAGPESATTDITAASACAAATASTTARSDVAATAATPHVLRTVHVPMGDSRWPGQVGHEVRLLVDRGVQAATLRLTPEHLGPVEVRIDIVNDKANVVFGAAQADTRAALIDALPKLREMFAGSGLALGDTGVRQDTPGGSAERSSSSRAGGRTDFAADEDESATAVPGLSAQIGLVDAYA